MKQKLVVIGAGMASGRVLEHLREQAPDQYEITLFNAEPRGNYNRIMLSPVLSGEKTYEEIVTHDDDWYAQNEITCRFGEHVVGIDRDSKTVTGQNGAVSYDKLLIATGSAPFIIPVPGKDLPGVIAYRDLDDTNAMVEASAKGGKAVVIGGGLLGLEAAAGMKAQGVDVTVIHVMGHLMERQLDEAAGYLLKKSLEEKGINVLTSANSQEILGTDGRVSG
ncbi:MAG: NAD(P)/FAD-dependent oxidoreductase, partial [Mameliella sp.]|nr:NAD(P)/FAD-dependent oxidoreductase [Mameliella sp.]